MPLSVEHLNQRIEGRSQTRRRDFNREVLALPGRESEIILVGLCLGAPFIAICTGLDVPIPSVRNGEPLRVRRAVVRLRSHTLALGSYLYLQIVQCMAW